MKTSGLGRGGAGGREREMVFRWVFLREMVFRSFFWMGWGVGEGWESVMENLVLFGCFCLSPREGNNKERKEKENPNVALLEYNDECMLMCVCRLVRVLLM